MLLELNVLISMNARVISVIQMLHVKILLVHISVNAMMVLLVMETGAKISMNA